MTWNLKGNTKQLIGQLSTIFFILQISFLSKKRRGDWSGRLLSAMRPFWVVEVAIQIPRLKLLMRVAGRETITWNWHKLIHTKLKLQMQITRKLRRSPDRASLCERFRHPNKLMEAIHLLFIVQRKLSSNQNNSKIPQRHQILTKQRPIVISLSLRDPHISLTILVLHHFQKLACQSLAQQRISFRLR